jgi:hypothetical protein
VAKSGVNDDFISHHRNLMISLSLPSIILETQKIKMNFYIKIELQKNQGTKWVQIRKLGLN